MEGTPSNAKITVERQAGGYTDRARAYKLLVDGEEKGSLNAGESVTAEVPAGSHQVQMKIDWATSLPIDVIADAGQEVRLSCKPNANPLTVLWWSTVARNRYIDLQPS